MRSVLVALLVTSAALLAGCSDDGGHEHESYTCPDGTELHLDDIPGHDNATFNPLSHCGGGSTGNTTTAAPNVLPVLVLTTTDDGGNVTNVTMLEGNLTFSAEGSTDSDGSITGIAVSVTDSNTTRTATLYDPTTKAFKSATFNFDRPGVVNVTVAMVDDRAGFTVNQTKVFVNHPQTLQGQNIQAPGGDVLTSPCTGGDLPADSGGAIVDAAYAKSYGFTLHPGATFVEATGSSGSELTICNPDSDPTSAGCQCGPVSESGNPVVTNQALPPPVGTQSYSVWATSPETPNNLVTVSVIVHYEPQTAAPAAE